MEGLCAGCNESLQNGEVVDKDELLAHASHSGHDKSVIALIEPGADLNSDRALYAAALKEHVQCLRLLLDAGADVKVVRSYKKILSHLCPVLVLAAKKSRGMLKYVT